MSSKERCYIKLEFPCINTIEFNNNHADVVKKLQSECLYMYGTNGYNEYEYHNINSILITSRLLYTKNYKSISLYIFTDET